MPNPSDFYEATIRNAIEAIDMSVERLLDGFDVPSGFDPLSREIAAILKDGTRDFDPAERERIVAGVIAKRIERAMAFRILHSGIFDPEDVEA